MFRAIVCTFTPLHSFTPIERKTSEVKQVKAQKLSPGFYLPSCNRGCSCTRFGPKGKPPVRFKRTRNSTALYNKRMPASHCVAIGCGQWQTIPLTPHRQKHHIINALTIAQEGTCLLHVCNVISITQAAVAAELLGRIGGARRDGARLQEVCRFGWAVRCALLCCGGERALHSALVEHGQGLKAIKMGFGGHPLLLSAPGRRGSVWLRCWLTHPRRPQLCCRFAVLQQRAQLRARAQALAAPPPAPHARARASMHDAALRAARARVCAPRGLQ